MNPTFKNNLSHIAKTRILSDRNIIMKDQEGYAENHIYFHFNEESLDNKFKILIIGSDEIDNPYFGGFYFFDGKLPDQYPFFPPKVLAKTQGLNTRFHPNFYTNGKCCLSILGTWSGPPWTSCLNIGTIAHSLKSLFIKNPINQEPSWENCTDSRATIYSRIIQYRSLQIATLDMLLNTPSDFVVFRPIMYKKFIKYYPKYINIISKMKKYHNKYNKSCIYNMQITYDIFTLEKKFINMYNKLIKTHNNINSNKILNNNNQISNINKSKTVNINKHEIANIKKTKKYQRKSPNDKASLYEIGFKKKSENGNKLWWIVSQTKNGQKRWKRHNI